MKSHENKLFMQMLREDISSSSMSRIDRLLTKQEARKRCKSAEVEARKQKSAGSTELARTRVPSITAVHLRRPGH